MPDFSKRSFEKELLDNEEIPFEDIAVTLDELHFINTWLGGYNATRYGLKQVLMEKPKRVRIVDVGCGGGHNLVEINKWCQKAGIEADLVGIDLKSECTQYAANNTANYPNITYITSDYRDVKEDFDIIHSCLFTHHLNDEQLKEYLGWARKFSRRGIIINDLHRNYLAYYSIKWLTKFFSNSYLVKNDACLSVLRSFKVKDWKKFLPEAKNHWNWAFRYTTYLKK
jgi:cyclopropane fatty-acyl-phospholipid synthase-like methyltransferase